MSLSATFTALGNSSTLFLGPQQSAEFAISGTFVATVLLEYSDNGGQSYLPRREFSAAGTVVLTAPGLYRFRCTQYTSGTVTYTGISHPVLRSQDAPLSSITYDGSGRVATYIRDGVSYAATYYSSGNGNGQLATLSGGGVTRTYTYNSDGLLTDEVVS